MAPRLAELEPAELGQQVDPSGRETDLDHDAGFLQVLAQHSELRDGRTEAKQRRPGLDGVGRIRVQPDVEVTGCPGHAMNRHRVGANDQEPRMRVEQRAEQIAEVVVQRSCRTNRRRTGAALRS
jgi:hypothetical protein